MISTKKHKRVIVGMSGGVDSSVAALLLKEQGLDVEGLFMKNWEEDDSEAFCSAKEDFQDAEQVCNLLDIPLHTINFSAEYWDSVFEHFLSEYKKGRTPNPDILCNREIKFKAFLNYAKSIGADYIATGHYAKISCQNDRFQLNKAFDLNKDQSYFLYTLTEEILSQTLFPLSDLDKNTVRKKALDMGFKNHQKKDSTGICFIGERKFKHFLSHYLASQKGDIKTSEGKVIGQHDGLMFYTLGQRQGLGIGGQADSGNSPWYVVSKEIETNTLIVTQGEDNPLLYKKELLASDIHWIQGKFPTSEFPSTVLKDVNISKDANIIELNCSAKIRYRQKDTPCIVIKKDENTCQVIFDKPERAITPGQSIVFYQNDICLGGGIIQ